jgi:hypothetical protein
MRGYDHQHHSSFLVPASAVIYSCVWRREEEDFNPERLYILGIRFLRQVHDIGHWNRSLRRVRKARYLR